MGQIQSKTGKRNVNGSTELKGQYLHSKNVLGTHRVLSNIRLVFLLHIPHVVSCAGPGFHPQQAVLFRELADPWTGGVAGWESIGGSPVCSVPRTICAS